MRSDVAVFFFLCLVAGLSSVLLKSCGYGMAALLPPFSLFRGFSDKFSE